jgi:hypothetical protein
LPYSLGRGHIMQGKSALAKQLRKCLGVKRKLEQNTILEYEVKTEAKMIIFEKKTGSIGRRYYS